MGASKRPRKVPHSGSRGNGFLTHLSRQNHVFLVECPEDVISLQVLEVCSRFSVPLAIRVPVPPEPNFTRRAVRISLEI